MATETLRPNSTTQHNFPSLSGSTAHEATNDDSDSTYIRNNTSTTQVDILGLDNTALTTETIDSIDIRSRARSESSANGQFKVGLKLSGSETYASYHTSVPTSATDYTDSGIARPGGGSWTVADLNSLEVLIEGDEVTSNGIRVFEVYVDVNNSPGGGGSTGQTKIKTGGSFGAKPVKLKSGGTFSTKPLHYKSGGTFTETGY